MTTSLTDGPAAISSPGSFANVIDMRTPRFARTPATLAASCAVESVIGLSFTSRRSRSRTEPTPTFTMFSSLMASERVIALEIVSFASPPTTRKNRRPAAACPCNHVFTDSWIDASVRFWNTRTPNR